MIFSQTQFECFLTQFPIKCWKYQEKEHKLAYERKRHILCIERDGREVAFGFDSEIMVFCGFCFPSRNVVYWDWTASQECRLCTEEMVVSRGNFYSLAADTEEIG